LVKGDSVEPPSRAFCPNGRHERGALLEPPTGRGLSGSGFDRKRDAALLQDPDPSKESGCWTGWSREAHQGRQQRQALDQETTLREGAQSITPSAKPRRHDRLESRRATNLPVSQRVASLVGGDTSFASPAKTSADATRARHAGARAAREAIMRTKA